MTNILALADDFAQSEIERYGLPSKINFDVSNQKGAELAKLLGADEHIVALGTRLMDVKLGEASANNVLSDHITMSADAAQKFLSEHNVSEEIMQKVLACVREHHETSWSCLEAEICANADCYRFLLVHNWLAFVHSLGAQGMPFSQAIVLARQKVDEKRTILSLPSCIKELTPHYECIQELLNKTRLVWSDKPAVRAGVGSNDLARIL